MGQDIAELWHFPLERFCDSIANNMGQKEIISCPFVPKRFKIGLVSLGKPEAYTAEAPSEVCP